jgi:hypothetical protein
MSHKNKNKFCTVQNSTFSFFSGKNKVLVHFLQSSRENANPALIKYENLNDAAASRIH